MFVLISLFLVSTTLPLVIVEAVSSISTGSPLIAEIAILLDNQTGYYSNYNRQSSLAEWSAIFRDVSSFFSSMNSVQVSFRVTSLDVVGTETKEMKSIYYTPTNETLEPHLCDSYGKTRPEFDIALMICGSKIMRMGKYIRPCKNQELVLAKVSVPGCKPEELIFNVADAIGEIFMLAVLDKATHCQSYRPINNEQQSQLLNYFECIMKQYVLYQTTASLKKINSRNTPPVLDPDFDEIIISQTVQEECQRMLNSSDAKIVPPKYTDMGNHNKCGKVFCWSNQTQKTIYFVPPENTICDQGKRCFHRKCVEAGSLILNVGTGLCLRSKNRFSGTDSPTFVDCPRSSLHSDRWRIIKLDNKNERCNQLVMSYINENLVEDKLLGVPLNSKIFQFENSNSQMFGGFCWKLDEVENREFVIVHERSGACIKYQDGEPVLSKYCDKQDPTVRWKFGDVFPPAGFCDNENKNNRNCTATTYLKLNASIVNSSLPNEAIVRVNISNAGEAVAVTPGALITWPNTLTLVKEPKRCFFMYNRSGHTCYKCKLGRILQQNETAELISLTFDFSDIGYPVKKISLTLTPTAAWGLKNVRNTLITFLPRLVHPLRVPSQQWNLVESTVLNFENWSTSTGKGGLQNIVLTKAFGKGSTNNLLVIMYAVLSAFTIGFIIIIVYAKRRQTRYLLLGDKLKQRMTPQSKQINIDIQETFIPSRDLSRERRGPV